MSINSLTNKIARPYAKAIYNFSVEQNLMYQLTDDFHNLEIFFKKTPNLLDYLANPLIKMEQKKNIIIKIFKSELYEDTLKILIILINKNRINYVTSIINNYLKLVYESASIKIVRISTAFGFTNFQKNMLIKKLKVLINSREIRLIIKVDQTLIGGFVINTESKIIDFSIKNQLKNLAKSLNSNLNF